MFLPMEPPTATYQEKKINWKTKTMYQSPESLAAREKLRAYLVQHIPEEPLAGPIRMTIIWGFHEHMGRHKNGDWYTKKPDLDNAQKAIQDIMTELGYWKDDAQVCSLNASKIWTWHPGISLVISEMEENAYAC